MSLLKPGDRFPSLTVEVAGKRSLTLPDALAGHYGVILFYRGSWCPYCNAQLSSFQRSQNRLDDVDTQIVALSVDDEATTQALIDKHHLDFPVGHSADAREIARLTGAFVNDDPLFLESTGFVLNPDGTVVTSVYSSNAIGRLVPDDVVGMIRYMKEHSPR